MGAAWRQPLSSVQEHLSAPLFTTHTQVYVEEHFCSLLLGLKQKLTILTSWLTSVQTYLPSSFYFLLIWTNSPPWLPFGASLRFHNENTPLSRLIPSIVIIFPTIWIEEIKLDIDVESIGMNCDHRSTSPSVVMLDHVSNVMLFAHSSQLCSLLKALAIPTLVMTLGQHMCVNIYCGIHCHCMICIVLAAFEFSLVHRASM